ncbi:hypothetical protein HK105_201071 [Polyrhizophydium stewartii]|uniref:PLOD1-3-like GT domain-containing protein n=1 Tax=Polyrhizophydium stewartii TaxID=2732419 RepID=A0ABR4NIY9_9FUNG
MVKMCARISKRPHVAVRLLAALAVLAGVTTAMFLFSSSFDSSIHSGIHSGVSDVTPRPELIVATFSTKANKGFCDTVLSAAAYGHVPVIVGWGEEWKGYRSKVVSTLSYFEKLAPTDVVLFHDGFDVHFQLGKERLLDAFLRQNASILYMAEKNCWPMFDARCDAFPKSPLPRWAWGPGTVYQWRQHELNIPHFLNAGTMMGFVGPSSTLFREMVRQVMVKEAQGHGVDDQELAAMLYTGGKFGVKLDFWMATMMSMHYSKDDTVLEPDTDNFRPAEAETHKIRRHKITGTVPGVLHYNGNGKEWMDDFAKESWWRNKELVDRSKVIFQTTDGQTVQWSKVCDEYYVPPNSTAAGEATPK